MRFIRSTVMAFSMFSAIPTPQIKWEKENMRYMLAALPLVGAVIGLVLIGWLYLCELLSFGTVLFAAGAALIPIAVTGGVHMDGFLDTVDALSSHAEPEKKRAILKDPRAGAFAVIFTAAYILAYFALASELPRSLGSMMFIGIIHILSRAAVGVAGLVFPASGTGGLLDTVSGSASRRAALVILAVIAALCAAGMLYLGLYQGVGAVLASVLCMLYVRVMSKRQFGGMSGDISGFLLQLSELLMLAAYILIIKAVTL